MIEPEKKLIYIISSMRSGSTLLKALIATRSDASNLPETPFQNVANLRVSESIVVIKKPAWYNDLNYPPDQILDEKRIVLIRNPYDTVSSLKDMNSAMGQSLLNIDLFLVCYWIMVYKNILDKKLLMDSNTLLVKYEELVKKPKAITKKIFKFIGSKNTEGIDYYEAPEKYQWKWGKDDGGEIIKSLKVSNPSKKRDNLTLHNLINSNSEIQTILSRFGYFAESS